MSRRLLRPRHRRRREIEVETATILDEAVAYWKASEYSGSGALLDLSGGGHDAQLGSTTGADTNDPLYLAYDELAYVYFPGASANYASVPDEAALAVGSDDLRIEVLLDPRNVGDDPTIASQFDSDANERSWRFRYSSGSLQLVLSTDGSTNAAFPVCSVAAPTGEKWVAIEYVEDTGAGEYSADFETSDDGDTWSALGTQQTGTSIGTLHDSTADILLGGINNFGGLEGDVKRLRLYIGGTLVLDIDFTSLDDYNAERTQLTAQTGQTVTINRNSSGRKTVVVDRDLFLLGTDDYFEVADHANFNFGAADDFTVVAVARMYGEHSSRASLVSKVNNTSLSWIMLENASATNWLARIYDGANNAFDFGPARTSGQLHTLATRVDRTAEEVEAFLDGVGSGSPADTSGVESLANTRPVRVGANAATTPGEFVDMEFVAAAFFPRALSDAEILEAGQELTT